MGQSVSYHGMGVKFFSVTMGTRGRGSSDRENAGKFFLREPAMFGCAPGILERGQGYGKAAALPLYLEKVLLGGWVSFEGGWDSPDLVDNAGKLQSFAW